MPTLVNDVDGYTCIKNLPLPKGVWRLKEFTQNELTEDQPLVYSLKRGSTESFAKACWDHHRLSALRCGRIAAFTSAVIWGGVVWTSQDSIVFTLPHARDTPSEYYIGWFELPSGRSLIGNDHEIILDTTVFPRESFRTEIVEGGCHIDVYCSFSLERCQGWLAARKAAQQQDFTVDISSMQRKLSLRLHSPTCTTCYGAHKGLCPFLELPQGLEPMAVDDYHGGNESDEETAVMDLDFEVATDVESVEKARALIQNRGPILAREDLVDAIIEHVKKNNFILIEAPPCSGKTILLNDVLCAVLDREPACPVDYIQRSTSAEYKPLFRLNHNTADMELPTSGPFWIFIDEAQLTYGDVKLWSILHPKGGPIHPDFWVVAAGSYGSHTSSFAHSPPENIEPEERMNLFFTKSRQLALAFTEKHFNAFMALSRYTILDDSWKSCIKKYASPCPAVEGWEPGLHPGVVVKMADFIVEQLVKGQFKGSQDEMVRLFSQDCLDDTNRNLPKGLGRCIPRRPEHEHGYTPAALMVFSAVLKFGSIEIPGLDDKVPPIVVSNAVSHLGSSSPPEPIRLHEIDRQYLRELYKSGRASVCTCHNAEFEHVITYVNENQIARTPRQRFLDVVPGLGVLNLKPFALRQMIASGQALNDFGQAAHDARRMGWLLQVPSEARPIRLVSPSQWHQDYLEYLLTPEGIPSEFASMSIDGFLHRVISRFRPSVLIHHNMEEQSLREKIYDSEFLHAAYKAVKDSRFLTPQARTKTGSGFADFVVKKRKWVIELMREGHDVQGHVDRFLPGGAYEEEWKGWEWRVVDFRYRTKARKPHSNSNFRTVDFLPAGHPYPVLHVEIIGKGLAKEHSRATLNG